MYKLVARVDIEGAHKLDLDYESPCKNLHGHRWNIEVTLAGKELNQNGMLCDFKIVKDILNKNVHDILDHQNLNDIFCFNPTAENISTWVADQMNYGLINANIAGVRCVKVSVFETAKNNAIWEED